MKPVVPAIVRAFGSALQQTLDRDLVAVYLGGSYSMDDFVPGFSDYDLMVIVDRPLAPVDLTRVASAHESIARLPEFERLEGDYVPRDWLVSSGTTQPVDWFRSGRLQPGREFMLSADAMSGVIPDEVTRLRAAFVASKPHGLTLDRILAGLASSSRMVGVMKIHAIARSESPRTCRETSAGVVAAARSMRVRW